MNLSGLVPARLAGLAGLLIVGLLAACGGNTQPPEGGGGDSKVVAAAAGPFHSLAVTDDGRVLAWGLGNDGRLGNCSSSSSTPKLVPGLTDIVAVAAGNRHSLALAEDGTVYAFGNDSEGQLGYSGTTSCSPVESSLDATIVAIGAANDTSFALDDEGALWAWGGNVRYGLGDGSTTSRNLPAKVAGLPAVVSFSASETAVFAVTEGEGVWAWGLGHAGMLGTGNTTDQTTPVRIESLDEYDMVHVAPGYAYAVALLGDGSLLGWGTNGQGQLGRTAGSPTTILTPDAIPDLTDVESLTAGPITVVAVIDGTPFTFGGNTNGELGTGSGLGLNGTPAAVELDGVIAVAMSHSGTQSSVLAVHDDGTLSGWGWNAYGQVGTGQAQAEYYTPVSVTLP